MELGNMIPSLPLQAITNTLLQIILTIGVPVVIAYFTAEVKIGREKKRERTNRERDWFEKTSSLCQLILWEFEHVDDEFQLSDRDEGVSLSELGTINEVEYLDERILELLNHSSSAPATIPDEYVSDIKRISFDYTNPSLDNPPSEITVGSIKEDLQSQLEDLERNSREEASERAPKELSEYIGNLKYVPSDVTTRIRQFCS